MPRTFFRAARCAALMCPILLLSSFTTQAQEGGATASGVMTGGAVVSGPGMAAGKGVGAAPVNAPTGGSASPKAAVTDQAATPKSAESANAQEGQPTVEAERLPPLNNQFQDFVQTSTGRSLPLFGYDMFRGVPSTFAPMKDVPVTPDYTLGPGDEVQLRVWGQVDIEQRLIVSRDGTVNIPRVGVVSLAGMKYQDLAGHLKSEIGRLYRNFELSVTLGQLRSIQIYVLGQARRPGAYTVSSLSTLVNAVFAVGGPSGKGSMRRVQLKRADKVVAEFDFYDLLQKGDKSHDVPLQPGDVLFFPVAGPLVAMAGSVNTPAIFELKDDKTSIGDVLQWAGGFTTVSGGAVGTLERLEDRRLRRVDDFTVDPPGLARLVRDGDVISFGSITPRYENAVSLKGFVASPGRYPLKPGMRIRDLLPGREALVSQDFWVKRNAAGVRELTPVGAIKNEVLRGEEINWDYAVVERINQDQSASLLPFNLGRAVLEGDPQHNLLLAPGDIVSVFSKDDIRVSQEKSKRFVTLEGEFVVPGIYEAQPGETLRQLVSRVGGFGRSSYLYGSVFSRESVRAAQQLRLTEAADRLEKDFQRSALERTQTAITKGQTDAVQSEAAAQRALINNLREVKAAGRVVLELPREGAQIKDLPDFELENGDRFVVPPMPSTVAVLGAVFNENSFIYRKGKRVGDYLKQAGGPTRTADTNSLYLLRADGSVASSQQAGWLFGALESERMMPGDALVVPVALERFNFVREAKAWTEVFYQFALGVAGLRVLQNGVK